MSKSLNNYIGITESPSSMFGKIMSISDELMYRYYLLLTDLSVSQIEELKKEHPRKAKEDLARHIITDFHNAEAADEAAQEFAKVFKEKQLPDDMEEVTIASGSHEALALLRDAEMVPSNSEARRLIRQGAVSLLDPAGKPQKISQETAQILLEPNCDYILKVGARKFKNLRAR